MLLVVSDGSEKSFAGTSDKMLEMVRDEGIDVLKG
jgi:hypothetical protein